LPTTNQNLPEEALWCPNTLERLSPVTGTARLGIEVEISERPSAQKLAEYPGVEDFSAHLGLDREVGETIQPTLVLMVKNLPVNRLAIARKSNAPRPDPTEGEGNLLSLRTLIDEAAHRFLYLGWIETHRQGRLS
jgi:hypothetical protein